MGPSSPVRSESCNTPKQRGQACERCWKRKQKCDRVLPACTACVGVGAQCIPRQFSIEPIRSSGRSLSHAAIPSYINTLKRKRDELEDRIQNPSPPASRSSNVPGARPPTAPSVRLLRDGSQHQMRPPAHDLTESTLQAAMGEIGFLSRSAMAEPRDEVSGFSEVLSMGRMVRAALALSGTRPSLSAIDPYSRRTTIINDQTSYIRKEEAVPFLIRFIESMASQLLYLDPDQLWKDFDVIYDETEEPTDQHEPRPAGKRFVVYMSVATGALLSPESGSLHAFAEGLQQRATKLLPEIIKSGSGVDILQYMLFLILYSLKTPRGGSTWHLIGLAMNKAVSFRFHNDLDSSNEHHSQTLSMLRNIFWSLYVLDRSISTIMDRPFNIEDDDITIQIPEQYLENSSIVEKAFACQLVAHARLISGIRDGALNGTLFHYSNVCWWRDSARAIKAGNSSRFNRGVIMQLSSRAMVEILKSVGSTNIESNMIHSPQTVKNDIMATCSEYIQHEYEGSDNGEFLGGFVEAYDIFAAGVVIICLTGKGSQTFSEMGTINKCTSLLTTVGERFDGLKVLRRVLWAFSDAVSGNPKPDRIIHELPPVIPSGIQSLIGRKLE